MHQPNRPTTFLHTSMTLRHPSWLFRRMHEKVVIVDGQRYITGGRNLAEAYYGMARKRNYVDRDVYVEGESAADAVELVHW